MSPAAVRSATTIAGWWLAMCLISTPVRAADTVDSAESKRLVQEGLGLRREGKDEEALERFRRAQQADPSPRTLAQIALAEQALRRWIDAEEHLVEALASEHPWIDERKDVLEEALSQIRSQIGTLEVRVNAPDAEVLVDGVAVDASSQTGARLAAGTHQVVARAPGFRTLARTVEVRSNAVTREEFKLDPLEPKPPAKAHDSSSKKTGAVRPVAGAPKPEPVAWRRTVAWAALAGGGALLASAVTAHAIREHNVAAYNDDSRCVFGELSRRERCGDRRGSAETAQVMAIIGYAAAGTALGISVAMFVTDSALPAREKPRAAVQFSTTW
jgi:hypothetical protein